MRLPLIRLPRCVLSLYCRSCGAEELLRGKHEIRHCGSEEPSELLCGGNAGPLKRPAVSVITSGLPTIQSYETPLRTCYARVIGWRRWSTAQRRDHRRRTLRMDCEIGLRMPRLPPLSDQSIYGQGSRTPQHKGGEAGEVQEVSFIARRPELCACSSHGHELDRTEPVGQMHSKNSHQQKRGHRQTDQGHEGAQKYCQAAEQLGQYGDPHHEVWRWHGKRVQDRGECLRALRQLGETVLYETNANDQAQRNRGPASDRKSPGQFERNISHRALEVSGKTQDCV